MESQSYFSTQQFWFVATCKGKLRATFSILSMSPISMVSIESLLGYNTRAVPTRMEMPFMPTYVNWYAWTLHTFNISSFEAETMKLSSEATVKRQIRSVWPLRVKQHWSVTRSQIFNDWSFEPDTIRWPSFIVARHLTNPAKIQQSVEITAYLMVYYRNN